MKKIVAVICGLMVCLSMASAKKKSSGKFVLGLDDSFPPLGFRDKNNEIVGYDIDLAREVASRLGLELVCQPIDWSTKEMELNTGKIDCIWNGLTLTEERKRAMACSEPYLANAQVVSNSSSVSCGKPTMISVVIAGCLKYARIILTPASYSSAL